MPRLCFLLLASLLLTACEYIRPTDSELTSQNWSAAGQKREADPAFLWCYKTLGRPDCSIEPQPGQEYRLLEGGPQPQPVAALTKESK
ncbi:MAG: hypothetical protein ACKVH0_06280 [Alphaproteobacteria bacterium]